MSATTRIAWQARSRWQKVAITIAMIAIVLGLGLWIASIALHPHLPTEDEVVARARKQADLAGGAQVFATHCAACHQTGIGPWLGGRGLDSEVIKSFVRNGPGPMPAFPAASVSDEDIAMVARYVATIPSKTAPK